MKGLLITASAFTICFPAMSQTPALAGAPANDPHLPLYLAGGAVVILMVLVAIVGIYVIRVLNILTEAASRQKVSSDSVVRVPKPSWWKSFIQHMNASVPVEQEKKIELAHSYDGIRELDNHLPPWWKWLFYGSIVWAVVYLIVFHLTDTLPLSQDEYKMELALADEQSKKYQASQPQAVVDENALEYKGDPETLGKGKSVFEGNNCGGCHRNDGGGNTIGPNLTDEYWLHGGGLRNVFLTIKNGVVEKGMPAWGKSMSAQDVRDVTFFVMSLQGTKPAEAKAPQGEFYQQEIEEKPDSLKVQAGL
jgi:cytochrome c oxidase cbb3-type subunit III